MIHRTAVLVTCLASLALAGACGGPGGGGEGTARGPGGADAPEAGPKAGKDWGEPVRGGQLVARYIGDAKYLNPVIQESTADSYVATHVFPYLTDSGWADCDITTPPMLAESWEWSDGDPGKPGGRTLTYKLRNDVVWADGEPITAEDVLFSYKLYGDPTIASPRFGYLEKIEDITAPDPWTVVFKFSELYPRKTQLFHTGLGIVPKHILGDVEPASFRSSDYNRSPVGAGPFRVARWKPGEEIVLERCETCNVKPTAYLDRVVVRIIPEETTALVALKRGTIDFMEPSTYEPIEDIRENHPEIRVIRRGYRFLDYIAWNTKDREALQEAKAELADDEVLDLDEIPPHPLFGDRNVRRALTMAVDIRSIMEAATTAGGELYGRLASGTVTPELCKEYADINRLPYDPKMAKRILAEAGWTDTDGDGILDKDGRDFRFTINYNSGNTRRRDGCVYVQSMLKQVGIAVEVEPIESSVFFQRLREKDFDASLAGWSAALVTDPMDIWHSGAEYVFNFTSYDNPEVDALIEKGRAEMDPEKRRKIWVEMQKLIYEDQPYTFLYWMDGIAFVHNRFQNVQTNILTAYFKLHEWWVPEELRKYDTRTARR